MGKIYLIGEVGNEGRYKIGMTRGCSDKRKKALQTGNAEELYVRYEYETPTPVKLEAMLHRLYKPKQLLNEWFELTEDDAMCFMETCQKYQNTINALSENPFFHGN